MTQDNGSKRADRPSGEVSPRATRRAFTREYKWRIVQEAATLRGTGGIGALLRREGLYSSTLVQWRREFESAAGCVAPVKRGPKPRFSPDQKAIQKLERENARLRKKVELSEALLDLQKKVLAVLKNPALNDENEQ